MKREATRGAIWGIAGQGVQFALYVAGYVVLARYLDKQQLGLAGLVLVVTGFLSAASDLGMGVLAVQRRRINDRRAHEYALASALGLVLVVSLAAPALGPLVGDPAGFVDLLRAGMATLFVAAFGVNARARLQRTLSFRSLVTIDVAVEAVRAVGRVGFAATGFGAWSIVLGDLIALGIGAAAAWLAAPPMNRDGECDGLLADGVRIVGARSADACFDQADRFAVGSRLGTAQLGLYSFAFTHTLMALRRLGAVAETVALPIFSRLKEDDRGLARAYCALTRIWALVVLVAAALLYHLADPLVEWLYPDRWREAVPGIRALCVTMAAAGLNSHPGLVWIARGRMRLRLWWSVANLGALAIVLAVGVRHGLEGVAYALAVRSVLATIIAQAITRRVVGVRHRDYLRALLPGAAFGLGLWGLVSLASG